MKPHYRQRYRITTKDGDIYVAEIYHLNPRFHRKADDLDFWRRVDDVPKKQKYIAVKDVVAWEVVE